jgi:hypothetical protein
MMVLRRRGVHTQLRVNLKPTEECDMCQVLSRDDGAPLGCVLRPPNGGEATYAYTITGALRRLGRARATTQPGVRSSARSAPRRARRGRRTPGVGPLFGLTPLGFRPDLARRRPEAPGGPARATISWEFECLLSMFSGIIAPCRWPSWRHGTWASSQACRRHRRATCRYKCQCVVAPQLGAPLRP